MSAPEIIDALLTAYRCTVGDLIDAANSIPVDDLQDVAETLTDCIKGGHSNGRCRREMVLLGAVMHRLIFDVHRVPKSRDAPL
jgi:hypothetical protein